MALSTYYYKKVNGSGKEFRDGVRACLYTVDPALTPSDTTAERKALAQAAVSAALGGVTLPTDYFETEQLIGAAAGGYLPADDDVVVISDFGITEVIA